MISLDPKHLKRIEAFVQRHLETDYNDRVRFLNTEAVIAYLDQLEASSAAREETVRGYKVTVTHARVDTGEAGERRKAVAKVIARSLTQMKGRPAPPS